MIIVFDFDGVISDSFELAYKYAKEAADEFNMNLGDKDEFRSYSNENPFRLLAKLNLPFWKIPNLVKRFKKVAKKVANSSESCKGIDDVIIELAKTHTLGIVSNGSEDAIKAFLEKHNLTKYFRFVYGMDTDKSKVKKLNKVKKEFGDNIIFITDTCGDIEEAKEAEVPTIAVTWGYQTKEMLEKDDPEYIVDHPKDILMIINTF